MEHLGKRWGVNDNGKVFGYYCLGCHVHAWPNNARDHHNRYSHPAHCAHWEENGTERGIPLYTQALPQMSVTWQPDSSNFVSFSWKTLEDDAEDVRPSRAVSGRR